MLSEPRRGEFILHPFKMFEKRRIKIRLNLEGTHQSSLQYVFHFSKTSTEYLTIIFSQIP